MSVLRIDTSDVERVIAAMADRLKSRRVFQSAIDILTQSVQYNFIVGGRPIKWKPPKYRIGQPLRDKGVLMNSIHGRVISSKKAAVSTRDIRAGTLHYGAKKGSFGRKVVSVKAHSRKRSGTTYSVSAHTRKQMLPWGGDIPPRPFLVIQVPQDIKDIEAALVRLAEGR